MSVCTCSEGRKESLKKVTCWEPGSYSLWSRIEAFWIVNLLWASSFQNKISAPWEGNVAFRNLKCNIWKMCCGNWRWTWKCSTFLIHCLDFSSFFFPSKGKNCEISKQVDTRLVGNIIDRCWCASSTDVRQTAASPCPSQLQTGAGDVMPLLALSRLQVSLLIWAPTSLETKMTLDKLLSVFACSKYVTVIVKLYMQKTIYNKRGVYEII